VIQISRVPFRGVKLFLSLEITGKGHSFFVILCECETGCIALVGNLGWQQKSSVCSRSISDDTARNFSR